jgi:transmembrane sensor
MDNSNNKYQFFEAIDFAQNDDFIHWVVNNNSHHAAFWQQFLVDNPSLVLEIDKAKLLVSSIVASQAEAGTEEASIKEKIWTKLSNEITPQKKLWSLWSKLSVAAACLAAFAGTYFLTKQVNEGDTIVYQTQYGEIKEFKLPDESTVILNANSSLKYTNNWEKNDNRVVNLNGEAFFKVSKQVKNNKKQKFTVHTQEADIEVIGTKFNVLNRNNKTTVSLNEGKINLITANTAAKLIPGDEFEVNNGKVQKTNNILRADEMSSWISAKWIFKSASLSEIIIKIENQFGKKVVLEDSTLAKEKITGLIPCGSLDESLEGLSAVYDKNIYLKNDKIIISNL